MQKDKVKKKLKKVLKDKDRDAKEERQQEETYFLTVITSESHPTIRQPPKEDEWKSSQDESGAPKSDTQTTPKKVLQNPKSFTEAKADSAKWVQTPNNE